MGRLELGRRCCTKRHRVHIIYGFLKQNAEIYGFHTVRYGNGDDDTLGSITRGYRYVGSTTNPINLNSPPTSGKYSVSAEHYL